MPLKASIMSCHCDDICPFAHFNGADFCMRYRQSVPVIDWTMERAPDPSSRFNILAT